MSFHVFCSSLRTQLTVLDIRVIVLLANFIGLVRVSFIFLQIPGFQISSRAYALAPGLHGTAWHGAVSLEKDEVMFCLYWQERRLKNPIIHYHTIYIYICIYIYILIYCTKKHRQWTFHCSSKLWVVTPKKTCRILQVGTMFFFMIYVWFIEIYQCYSPALNTSVLLGKTRGWSKLHQATQPAMTTADDLPTLEAPPCGFWGNSETLLNTMDTTDKDE